MNLSNEVSNILICAATPMELASWPRELSGSSHQYNTFCTGPGIPLCLAQLLGYLEKNRPMLIINIGIAGAYPHSGYRIGDVVLVEQETFGDVGVESSESSNGFIPLSQFDFGRDYKAHFDLVILKGLNKTSDSYGIHMGSGCTVNSCTGSEKTGVMRETLFSSQVETMEGAAVGLAGRFKDIPVMEIRAISNMASERNMKKENIELALIHLKDFILTQSKVFSSESFPSDIALSQ